MSVPQGNIYIFDPITQEKKPTNFEFLQELTGLEMTTLRGARSRKTKLRGFGWYIIDNRITRKQYRKMIEFDINDEIWKKIKDVNYEISSYGRLRHFKTKRIRMLHNLRNEVFFTVIRDGKQVKLKAHKVAAETFGIEKCLNAKCVVHVDGNYFNNRIENLKWVTLAEFREKLRKSQKTLPVLKLDDVTGEVLDTYLSITDAARENFVDTSSISKAIINKHKCCGFVWSRTDTLKEVKKNILEGKYVPLWTKSTPVAKKDVKTKEVLAVYSGVKEITELLNVDKTTIYRAIIKKYPSQGFLWEYVKEVV